MDKKTKADMLLLIVVITWGTSNYFVDMCLEDLGTFTLNMFRFFIGFLAAAIFGFKSFKKINKTTLMYGCIMALFMSLSYFLSTLGIQFTTISNTGFFGAMSVLFAPIGEWLILKKKQDKKLFVVVAICLLGVLLLSMKGDFSINTANMKGDVMCTLAALAYTFNILLTGKAVSDERVDAFCLGLIQLFVVGVFNGIFAFALEEPHLPQSSGIMWAMLFLAVVCTGLAFIVQPIAQQYTTGAHVGIIFCLEPVFCAIVALVFAHEVLFTQNYIGMVLLMMGMLLMEITLPKFFRKRTKIVQNEKEGQKCIAE